jgi:hypothetical protein
MEPAAETAAYSSASLPTPVCRFATCEQPANPAMRTPADVRLGRPGVCDLHAGQTVMADRPGWWSA